MSEHRLVGQSLGSALRYGDVFAGLPCCFDCLPRLRLSRVCCSKPNSRIVHLLLLSLVMLIHKPDAFRLLLTVLG